MKKKTRHEILRCFPVNLTERFLLTMRGLNIIIVITIIIIIDKINPQTAARIITPMTNISKFNDITKNRIKIYLKKIINSNPSNDVFEVVSKVLA